MEKLDLTLDQKEEMIRTVWGIMESQADQVFGLHPVQTCGKGRNRLAHDFARGIDSKGSKRKQRFNRVSQDN